MIQEFLLAVYLAGMIAGLLVMYEPFPTRVLMAAIWPVGPLAFAVVVTILIATALVVFPAIGLGVAAAALLGWLALSS